MENPKPHGLTLFFASKLDGIEPKRPEVGHQAIQEIASYANFTLIVEAAAGFKIRGGLLKDDDRPDTHQRNWSRI